MEGGKTEYGVSVDDLMLGLDEGSVVEARRPNKVYLQGTGVSWNATGSSLAVAFGRGDIAGWCDYPGAVCMWNVFGKAFDAANPDAVLDHSSCIMSVACHPQQPALVAGGSFNGEVVVWDLTLPEQLLAVSAISEYGHKEPVLGLEWVHDALHGEWLLCSVAADGRVLFWSTANGLKHPVRGALLAAHADRGSSRSKGAACHGAASVSFAGGVAGGASTAAPKWFVVGQQGGAITRGQVAKVLGVGAHIGDKALRNAPAVEDLYPPVRRREDTFAHERHIGAVNAVCCSPFNRNLFLTAGSDGTVRLFHMFDRAPLRQWEPAPPPGTPGASGTFSAVTCIQFSPVRPLLFAAGSDDGFVYLFDLSSPASVPVLVLEAKPAGGDAAPGAGGSSSGDAGAGRREANKGGTSAAAAARADAAATARSAVTGLVFNRRQRDLLAACDYLGRVHVWRLSWGLSHKGNDEQALLDAVASVGADASATPVAAVVGES